LKRISMILLQVILLCCAYGSEPVSPPDYLRTNQNISNGNLFDGEPYLAINPEDNRHMIIAWMGYLPQTRIFIKTKTSFDGGVTWSEISLIPHTNSVYGSADPSLAFDDRGNVFLAYIDFNTKFDSGAVYLRKSEDGGLNWGSAIEVIHAHSDQGHYPIDRPWISIDSTGGSLNGTIYISSMPPSVFGPLPPPYRPYLIVSNDGGESFQPWKYLDDSGWLAGNQIQQPMPIHTVSSSGVFHCVYPSYVPGQNTMAQFILASSRDGGFSFSYRTVLSMSTSVSDPLAKKSYLIKTDPTNPLHLTFIYLNTTFEDIDVFIIDSFDEGSTWSEPIRANDDPVRNQAMQDLAWADYDTNGDLIIAWRDRRNGTDSTYATSYEIWGTLRHHGSTQLSRNFRISDSLIDYDSILSHAGNDFMCLAFQNNILNAVWGDTRNGTLNIWFQSMSFPDIETK